MCNMAEELLVTLLRGDCGFGFSLLGTAGLPHVIYDIVENSPAAESGKVEAGDVILRVNEVDVNRFTTKEVLKCLRLSSDSVTLKLRRDPSIKAHVRRLLSTSSSDDNDVTQQQQQQQQQNNVSSTTAATATATTTTTTTSAVINKDNTTSSSRRGSSDSSSTHNTQRAITSSQYSSTTTRSNGSYNNSDASSDIEALLPQSGCDDFKEEERAQWEPLSADKFARPKATPRFEAYMMTGDLMLNLSRTQQSSGLLPKYQKKVDSLRYNNNHTLNNHHNYRNNVHHHHFRHHHDPEHLRGTTAAHQHNSVPTSPSEMLGHHRGGYKLQGSNSASTSPVSVNKRECLSLEGEVCKSSNVAGSFGYSSGFVRTSRSEDHLQFQKDPSMSTVDIEIDDDVTSSLNTLLDTRAESGQVVSSERIVWTYNAPVSSPSASSERTSCCQNGGSSAGSSSSSSQSSTEGSSPQRSLSPASPTSVSSSVMSSNSGSRRFPLLPTSSSVQGSNDQQASSVSCHQHHNNPTNGDFSQSEVISNMSSPDYNDEETMDILSSRDIMMVSDPSDSDSTILASEPPQRSRCKKNVNNSKSGGGNNPEGGGEHRIVIQVMGADNNKEQQRSSPRHNNKRQQQQQEDRNANAAHALSGEDYCQESRDHEVIQSYEEHASRNEGGSSPPMSADEESDIESLHSFHYSPKAVDLPSAVRLAKRLYTLDGFKKSDVSRHLSKNNDFSRAVAEEYLKYFNFERDTLDVALRKFLAKFSLTGETQERERVLVHFSKRFLDCNPGTFNSQDAVHTLTCAIMLLNTDLHGMNIGRKMTCTEFIENLSELNDGENFPKEVLKQLYHAIKSFPLEWAMDEDGEKKVGQMAQQEDGQVATEGGNPFLDVGNSSNPTEFKKGYVMRKCCHDANGKKTPFGKRGWKMYYCTLRDLVLYLHKDEHGLKNDSLHNAVPIHHALATKAADYTKKEHVFRLQTAEQAEYLFQTSDSKELQSWIDTINFVSASLSSRALPGAVGSQRKFQRPLLPCSNTKLSPTEQLRDHEERVSRLEAELDEHRRHPPERGAKALAVQNYKEKDVYLHHELKRYKTYVYLLRSHLALTEVEQSLVENSIGEVDETVAGTLQQINVAPDASIVPPPIPDRPATNRLPDLDTS